MPKTFPLVFFVVIVATVFAAVFTPSEEDLAYFSFRDGDYQTAGQFFEEKWLRGEASAEHIFMLAYIHILEGHRERAVGIVERLLKRHPDHPVPLALANSLYAGEAAQVAALKPGLSETRDVQTRKIRQAIMQADAAAQGDKVIAGLMQMQGLGVATQQELIQLGRAQAAQNNVNGAIDALDAANRLAGGRIDVGAQRLLFAMLVEQGREADGVALAHKWYGNTSNSADKLAFGYWLLQQGWPELAPQVVGASKDDPSYAQFLAYADVQRGDAAAALTRFRSLDQQGDLDPELILLYGELAASQRSEQDATKLLPRLKQLALDDGSTAYRRGVYVGTLRYLQRYEELTQYWRHTANDSRLAAGERDDILLALVAAGWHKDIIVALRLAVESRGGDWLAAYIKAATELGETQELIAMLALRGMNPRVASQERQQIAHTLLELGSKNNATNILMALAVDADPSSPTVQELLYFFGPRPPEAALTWLENQVKRASADKQAAWLAHLAENGGEDRIVNVMRYLRAPIDPIAHLVVLESLSKLRRWSEFRDHLQEALKRDTDSARRNRYAQLATLSANDALIADAWGAVLQVQPEDMTALQEVGMAAYRRNDFDHAVIYLERYINKYPNNWEVGITLGQLLWEKKQQDRARKHYQNALNQLKQLPNPNRRERLISAITEARLGALNDATQSFELLRFQNPYDLEVLAEYAGFLLSRGMYAEATRVLDGR